MVQTKMGRYWEQAKRWLICKVWPFKAKEGGAMNSMMKQAQRNYTGSYVSGDLGGVRVGNKSYQKYYSNPGFKMPKI